MERATVIKKTTRATTEKPVASAVATAKPKASEHGKRRIAQVIATTLPAAMTGRASPTKAKGGGERVFAYIRRLPQPQRGIAERVDALDEASECGQA